GGRDQFLRLQHRHRLAQHHREYAPERDGREVVPGAWPPRDLRQQPQRQTRRPDPSPGRQRCRRHARTREESAPANGQRRARDDAQTLHAVGAQAGQRRAAARSTRWEERQARSGHGSSHGFWRLSIRTATDRERQSIRTATSRERQGFPESKKHYKEVSPLIHLRLSATEVAGSRLFLQWRHYLALG